MRYMINLLQNMMQQDENRVNSFAYKPSFSCPGMGTAVKKRRKTSMVNKVSMTRSDTNHVSSRVIMSWGRGERRRRRRRRRRVASETAFASGSPTSGLSGVDTPTSNARRNGMKNTVYLFGAHFLIGKWCCDLGGKERCWWVGGSHTTKQRSSMLRYLFQE